MAKDDVVRSLREGKEQLDIPEPRVDVPLDSERLRGQQVSAQPTNNPLVAEPEATLDDTGPEPDEFGFAPEVSAVPLSNETFEERAGEDELDFPPLGFLV